MPGLDLAAKALGYGAKALGWAARHPVATDAAVGAGVGLVTSGFSGWGALTGAVGGAIGGGQGRGRYQAGLRADRQAAVAEVASLRKQMRAGNFGMREARSQMRSVEAGFMQDSIRLSSTRGDYLAARRDARSGRRRVVQGGGAVGGASRNLWPATRGSSQGSMSVSPAKMNRYKAAEADYAAAKIARRTSAADLARIKGKVGQMSSQRKELGTRLGAAVKRRNQLYSTSSGRGIRALSGAAVGGAIGGGAIGLGRIGSWAMGSIGSSYGSQNQNPYGATFSGMGNGTVGGY